MATPQHTPHQRHARRALEQAKAALGGNVRTVVLNMLHPSEVKQFFE